MGLRKCNKFLQILFLFLFYYKYFLISLVIASGGDGIPAELLKILKDDAVKVLTPSVQFSSVAQLCPTLCDPMDCSTPGFPVDHQLPELAQTHVHPFGNAVQPTQPLSSPSPPAFNLSQHQGLFHSESVLHIRWPKYWNFSFSISPSNELHMSALHMSANLENSAMATGLEKVRFHSNAKEC